MHCDSVGIRYRSWLLLLLMLLLLLSAIAVVTAVALCCCYCYYCFFKLSACASQHVQARHTLWFEKTKPGELKNKRAYQMLILKIYSR
jgi:hypothetical protein